MAFLEDLPNELLRKIFSYLGCEDLVCISMVSRHLNATADPCIYRSPWVTYAALCKFLRTILSRPMLANYVRSVSLHPSNSATLRFLPVYPILNTTADTFGLEDRLDLKGGQIILLLHILPRLESFAITSSELDISGDFLDRYKFQPATTLPIGLKSLRNIGCHQFLSDDMSPHTLLTILLLPSIHTVEIWGFEKWDTDDLYQFEGTSMVKDLQFRQGNVDAPTLARILKIPIALERFAYGHSFPSSLMWFDAPEIGKILGTHRATLQLIDICFDRDSTGFGGAGLEFSPGFGGGGSAVQGIIGSLREWPVLVELHCDLTLLLGVKPKAAVSRLVDVLPVALQEFGIRGDRFWKEKEIADEVKHMLDMREAYGLHSLKVLRVAEYMRELRDLLKAPCEAAGIYLGSFQE